MKAKEIMVTDFPVISVQTSIAEALQMLKKAPIDDDQLFAAPGMIVVNDKGELAGILSPLTIIRALLDAAGETGSPVSAGMPSLEELCLRIKDKAVEDIMDWQPISVTQDAHILDVADLFVKNRFQRIPVVENKKVLGIIYRSRLLFAMTQCL